MKSDQHWIEQLVRLARDTPRVGRARLASCMVHKGAVVAWGFNSMKSHPLAQRFGKNADAIFLHSEVDCIRNAVKVLEPRELVRSTLYTARVKQVSSVDRRLIHGLARPCTGCAKAIAAFNIGRAVWTLDDNGFTCTHEKDLTSNINDARVAA